MAADLWSATTLGAGDSLITQRGDDLYAQAAAPLRDSTDPWGSDGRFPFEQGPNLPPTFPPLDDSGASIELRDGLLIVYGTDNADTIDIKEISSDNTYPVIEAVITSWRGDIVLSEQFAGPFVDRILVYGGRLGDAITNHTALEASLYGQGGDDILQGGRGLDHLIGGDGDDAYRFQGDVNMGMDHILEQDGKRDHLDFSAMAEGVVVDLGLRGAPQQVNSLLTIQLNLAVDNIEDVTGSSFNDEIIGSYTASDSSVIPKRVNHLRGLGGDDVLTGLSGDDLLIGGDGNDEIDAGDGDDRIEGGGGNDVLVGGDGNDVYVYAGNESLGIDDIHDRAMSRNRYDFTQLGQGIQLDLRGHGFRQVNDLVTLWVFNPGSVLDVLATDYDDLIWGNEWDNWIDGNAGNDQVTGYDGEDTLLGGAGNDVLNGGRNNDSLYGDIGDDILRGADGDDGLWGGLGRNHVYGGVGNDRHLHQKNGATNFTDRTSDDVLIHFVNRDRGDVYPTTVFWKHAEYSAGAWIDDDVQLVDQALKHMQDLTGNQTLLAAPDGVVLEFRRYGFHIEGDSIAGLYESPVPFVNDGGNVSMTDFAFAFDDWTRYVVYHEVAHAWEEGATDYWDEFVAINGEAASEHAKEDNGEDWAESVATYIGNEFGNSIAEDQIDDIPRKAEVVRKWIESISEPTLPYVMPTTATGNELAFDEYLSQDDGPASTVGGHDFLAWQRGFDTVAADNAEGDLNGDGQIDEFDLEVFQSQFGETLPEPLNGAMTAPPPSFPTVPMSYQTMTGQVGALLIRDEAPQVGALATRPELTSIDAALDTSNRDGAGERDARRRPLINAVAELDVSDGFSAERLWQSSADALAVDALYAALENGVRMF